MLVARLSQSCDPREEDSASHTKRRRSYKFFPIGPHWRDLRLHLLPSVVPGIFYPRCYKVCNQSGVGLASTGN